MGRPRGTKLTPEIARDLCARTGSKAYLTGSISNLGAHYVIGISAVNCQTGDNLAREQAEADSKEHVLKALSNASTKLRETPRRIAQDASRNSIRPLSRPPRRRLKPSKPTASARKSMMRRAITTEAGPCSSEPSARPEFRHGLCLARDTPMAISGKTSLAAENTQQGLRAARPSERAGEVLHRVSLLCHCHRRPGKGALRPLNSGRQTYPRDLVPVDNLGGIYRILGQYDKRLAENREALRLDPKAD